VGQDAALVVFEAAMQLPPESWVYISELGVKRAGNFRKCITRKRTSVRSVFHGYNATTKVSLPSE